MVQFNIKYFYVRINYKTIYMKAIGFKNFRKFEDFPIMEWVHANSDMPITHGVTNIIP